MKLDLTKPLVFKDTTGKPRSPRTVIGKHPDGTLVLSYEANFGIRGARIRYVSESYSAEDAEKLFKNAPPEPRRLVGYVSVWEHQNGEIEFGYIHSTRASAEHASAGAGNSLGIVEVTWVEKANDG